MNHNFSPPGLIALFEDYCKRQNFAAVTESAQRRLLNRLISYMETIAVSTYTPEVGESFIVAATEGKNLKNVTINSYRRLVYVLSQAYNNKTIHKQRTAYVCPQFRGEIGKCALNFIRSYSQDNFLAKGTIYFYEKTLYRFSEFLISRNCTFKNISREDIIAYLSTSTNQDRKAIGTIKIFLNYIFENKIVSQDYSHLLIGFKDAVKEVIPSFYTVEEIKKLESSVSRATPKGKRDYAMILLASRLGLRISDIQSLRFCNIDWDNNTLKVHQVKTSKYVELPLLSEVGDAIIDYILNARPNVEDDFVFLTLKPPFRHLNGNSLSPAITKYMLAASIDVSKRHHGPHALRHSLASNLLQNETPVCVITSTLGQASTQSTMHYLDIDIRALINCSLEVPAITTKFYKENGSAFYK